MWARQVPPDVDKFAVRLELVWPRVRAALITKQTISAAYKNAKQEMVSKFRVTVTSLDGSEVLLGKPMWSKEEARGSYCLESCAVTEEGEKVYGADADHRGAYFLGYAAFACHLRLSLALKN